MVDKNGEPVSSCRLPTIDDKFFGPQRYVALLNAPLIQAASPWTLAFAPHPAPALTLVLVLPEPGWPGVDEGLLRRVVDSLVEHSPVALDPARVTLVRGGRASGIRAMAEVEKAFARGERGVLLAGVDSYFDPDVVDWLDREYRLHGLQTENGVIPGEGAGALLLSRSATVGQPLGEILAWHVETEPRPWGSEEPCHALGMSVAIKTACLASVGAESRSIAWVMTDVANERHRVSEWQLAYGRHFRAFAEEAAHDQPLLDHGELGAATFPILAAILCTRWTLGVGEGPVALVAAHSDGPERGACIVREHSS